MDEFVYPEAFDVSTREGLTELRGAPFGPAGTSAVELPDGTTWEVDQADPGQLVSLVVVGELDRSLLVRDLLGPERFDVACARLDADRASRKQGKRLRASVPGGPGGWRGTLRSSGHRGDLATMVGTAVQMADMSTDESLAPLVRLAAGLEFVTRVRDGLLGSVFEQSVEPMAVELYDLALQVGPDDFYSLGRQAEKPLHQFGAMARWVRQEVSSLELPLTHVLDLLDEYLGRGSAASDVAPPPAPGLPGDYDQPLQGHLADGLHVAAMAAPFGGGDLGDVHMAPAAPPAEDFVEVEMPDAGQLVVRVSRRHHGKWVRVLKAAGLVPLALVPLDEDGMLLAAVAVLPPDLEASELVVEVVDPDEAAPLDRPLSLVRAAVEAGRAAARYDRLARRDDASSAWLECSRLWTEAGDRRRSALAEDRALGSRRGHRGTRLAPFVADELLAASMGERRGKY